MQEYELFLRNYYQRLSEEEKQNYERQKGIWDREVGLPGRISESEEFDWKGRDRVAHFAYGLYYGISLVSIFEFETPASVGIPLITAGLWTLGPAINTKKYEGITRATVRAGNSGKILGLLNGVALGMALAGNSEDGGKVVLGLSTVGSIILGEVAFQWQKQKRIPAGHVEMMRHYGFLGPWVGYSMAVASGTPSTNLLGVGLLVGGISGLVIGNQVAKKYAYTLGDVDAISTFTLISTGIGFATVAESFNSSISKEQLIIVPAVASIIGTLLSQKSVRGAHLTDKQGSTRNLSTAGAALVGLGIVTMTKSSSPAVWIGVPSGLALITHQVLLRNYKKKNLEVDFRGGAHRKSPFKLSLSVTPENYFVNKGISLKEHSQFPLLGLQYPIFKIRLKF